MKAPESKNTSSSDRKTEEQLRADIVGLAQYVQRFREEIAGVVESDGSQTRFRSMTDQLDAIVSATEEATHAILERAENIDSIVDKLRDCEDAAERNELCNRLNEESSRLLESCTFQDITGQRVTKIVRSMKFVEERVQHIAALWGHEGIERLAVQQDDINAPKDPGEVLDGPALPHEESVSQKDIDKLFD